jgi:hypothetical protein
VTGRAGASPEDAEDAELADLDETDDETETIGISPYAKAGGAPASDETADETADETEQAGQAEPPQDALVFGPGE